MPVANCPFCKTSIRFEEKHAGAEAVCPSCKNQFRLGETTPSALSSSSTKMPFPVWLPLMILRVLFSLFGFVLIATHFLGSRSAIGSELIAGLLCILIAAVMYLTETIMDRMPKSAV